MSNNDIERGMFEAWYVGHYKNLADDVLVRISAKGMYRDMHIQACWMGWKAAKQPEWQPIDTFPKDREILILSNLNNRYVGMWAMNVETGNEAFIIINDDHGNQMVVELENIKSWCELPQPPKEQS